MASDSYDFVIIGGGTAGLVLANRLTENPQVQVLVLEAGEDLTADPRVTTPALFPTLIGSDADWNTVTESQVGVLPIIPGDEYLTFCSSLLLVTGRSTYLMAVYLAEVALSTVRPLLLLRK